LGSLPGVRGGELGATGSAALLSKLGEFTLITFAGSFFVVLMSRLYEKRGGLSRRSVKHVLGDVVLSVQISFHLPSFPSATADVLKRDLIILNYVPRLFTSTGKHIFLDYSLG